MTWCPTARTKNTSIVLWTIGKQKTTSKFSFEFTDADREEARLQFEDWAHEKAEDDDVYGPYEVRLASDEVEE